MKFDSDQIKDINKEDFLSMNQWMLDHLQGHENPIGQNENSKRVDMMVGVGSLEFEHEMLSSFVSNIYTYVRERRNMSHSIHLIIAGTYISINAGEG